MNIAELKLELIARIIATNNVDLLLKIKDALEEKNYAEAEEKLSFVNEAALKYESVRVFSEEEQRKINIALKQVENGDYITDEEAQIEIEKWFEEQE